MNERFKLNKRGKYWEIIQDDKIYLDEEDVVNLLNDYAKHMKHCTRIFDVIDEYGYSYQFYTEYKLNSLLTFLKNECGFELEFDDKEGFWWFKDDEKYHNLFKELDDVIKKNKQLSKENIELKERNEFVELLLNHRGDIICFTRALIMDEGSDEMKKMFFDFRDSMWEKWKKQRGIEL